MLVCKFQSHQRISTPVFLTHSWINTDKGIDFELEGYELSYISRQNKGGGGVALYVDNALKLLDNMTTVIDNVLEGFTIQIYKEKQTNVIIIYVIIVIIN